MSDFRDMLKREDGRCSALPVRPVNGVERIAAERRRQIEAEGWTPDHDDEHVHGELARAAAGYALSAAGYEGDYVYWPADLPGGLKISVQASAHHYCSPRVHQANPTHQQRIALLTKAGALIAAEIDRLLRLTPEGEPQGEESGT